MSPIPAISSTNPVSYQSAKAKALQLINGFNTSAPPRSNHYPKLVKSIVVKDLNGTLNNTSSIITQGKSSLCGPAAFFFSLARVRPDIYAQLVIDLYSQGRARIKDLELQSSAKARQHKPIWMRQSDWMLLSSIKPEYDDPSEQIDGITLPGKLKEWFKKAGFGTVQDYTNLVFNKGLETLLQAQTDSQTGHTICLLADFDLFEQFVDKTGRSFFPNHWVVMTSDIRIRKFHEKSGQLDRPKTINPVMVKMIKSQIQSKQIEGITNGNYSPSTETGDRILLDAFTWGKVYSPVISRINASQDALLSYFLRGFYGYIKVKR